MLTFQDYEEAISKTKKETFILKAIKDYVASDTYIHALIAQDYYATDNTAIGNRMGYLERQMRKKVNVTFHRLRNGFFPKAVKRLVMYTMGNGATLEDDVKLKIDRKFDNKTIIAAINACVDSVSWGFVDIDHLTFFRVTEFVPLVDERTSQLRAGIRFWQIDENKPMYIELYEVDGITEYKASNKVTKIEETAEQRAYKQTVRTDAFGTTPINGENYGVLPIFPLYANELATSELTTGLKALIDAYDFVSSDLADGITLIEGLYNLVHNYGGDDMQQLLAEIHAVKTILTDGDAGGSLEVIEIPFEAKRMALDLYEKRMYDDWLLPNKNTNRGSGNITAREIEDAREDMNIKADLLEWQVAEFIENVLKLKGVDLMLPDYKRRTTNNDTETIQNISTQIAGEWIDEEQAIKLDPTIPTDDKEKLIARIALRDAGIPSEDTDVDSEE